MYDELVKRLRYCAEEPSGCGTCDLSDNCVLRSGLLFQAADAIEAQNKPKWIPVAERLPPAKKEVYVTDGEYIARANLLDEVFPGDKPCWSYSGLGEITHWCEQIPLPKPPKEET